MSKCSMYFIRPEKYWQSIKDMLLQIENKNIIYVATNRGYQEVQKIDTGTHKFFFVDCISNCKDTNVCTSIASPSDTTGISLTVDQYAKHIQGEKVIIIDSLSVLLMYNSEEFVGRFVNSLITRAKTLDADIIIIVLDSDAKKDIVQKIVSFTDETKHLSVS